MAEDIKDDGDSSGSKPSTLDHILGSISPLYGMLSGSGLGQGLMGVSGLMMGRGKDPMVNPLFGKKKKKKPGEPLAPGEVPAMAKGGRVKGKTNGPPFGKPKNKTKAPNPFGKKPKGTGAMAPPFTKKFAKGGSVRGDGCASRGRTKGSMR